MALQGFERSLLAVQNEESVAPRERWDLDFLAHRLGPDPAKVFAWVRNSTFWIPYRGVLRGAAGVLMDRQGNDLDRALLLCALLERTGHTARLARGEVTREQALQLLPSLVARRGVYFAAPEVPAASGDATGPVFSEGTGAVVAQYQPVAIALGRRLQVDRSALDLVALRTRHRVAEQGDRLLALLGRSDEFRQSHPSGELAGIAAGSRQGDEVGWRLRLQKAVEALQNHWWVQYRQNQKWVDLDLLGDESGSALTSAKETPTETELAPALYQQVSVRVISEVWSGGRVKERTSLEHAFRASDGIGTPLVLQFWPTAWLADATGPGSRHTLLEATTQDQWAATLSRGNDVLAGGYVTESAHAISEKGGPFGAMASDAFGAGSVAPGGATDQDELSAVWLEYDIGVPGEAPRVVRRTIFDLIGPAARTAGPPAHLNVGESLRRTRALAMTMRTEILFVPCAFPPEFVAHEAAQNALANRALLTGIAERVAAGSTAADVQGEGAVPRAIAAAAAPVSPLLAFAALRMGTETRASAGFVGRVNILTRHRFFSSQGQRIAVMEATDIVSNELDVDLAATDPFAIRVRQGVLDTNLETLIGPGRVTRNVAEAFAASGDWIALAPGDVQGVDRLNLPPDVRRSIQLDLANGYAVIAPKDSAITAGGDSPGWWRIDARTGDTLGVDAQGWGMAATERASLTQTATAAFREFSFEFVLCHGFGQALNDARWFDEIFGGWHPSWTQAASKSEDPSEVAKNNNNVCLLSAIASGCLSTLPLVLLTLRWRMLDLADEEAAAAAGMARETRGGTQPLIHPGGGPAEAGGAGAAPAGAHAGPPPAYPQETAPAGASPQPGEPPAAGNPDAPSQPCDVNDSSGPDTEDETGSGPDTVDETGTGPVTINENGRPETVNEVGKGPDTVDQSGKTNPGTSDAPARPTAPMTVAQAEQALAAAEQASGGAFRQWLAASKETDAAQSDWLQYRATGSNPDPTVEKALRDRMNELATRSETLAREADDAQGAVERARGTLKGAKTRAAGELLCKPRGGGGAGGGGAGAKM